MTTKAYYAEYYQKNRDRIIARVRARERRIAAEKRAAKAALPPPTEEELAKKAEAKRARNRERLKKQRANPAEKERRKLYAKTYNPLYREKNREKYKQLNQAWYAKNSDKQRQKRILDPAPLKAARAARRARLKNAGGTYTAQDIRDLLKTQRKRCAYCSASLKNGFHADHVMPLARGGTNSRNNIQLLCAPCNRTKGWKHPLDFAREQGLLL